MHNENKSSSLLVLKPWKEIVVDIRNLFILNIILLYSLFWLTDDTTVAMFSTIFVIVVAIRGGLLPGVIASAAFALSGTIALLIPPHTTITVQYYFNQRVPGYLVGFAQSLIAGLVVGYISSLAHRLREEINFRKQVQKDLEQKVAELDAFGHSVAHDLRNPLMIINMSSQSLVKDFAKSNNERVQKKLSFISESSEQMVDIIESILLLAGIKKMNMGEFALISVQECVDEALKRMKFNIELNNATIIAPDKWPEVFGYSRWITEVWVNYISNALKYGFKVDSNSAIEIELGFDTRGPDGNALNDYIRFWVKDNGEGIPQEKLSSLFREFTQLHRSPHSGYGLGLSIVKSIISKSGGTVGVESEVGKGSLFYFTLPTRQAALQNVT